jgi:hypothetical protein
MASMSSALYVASQDEGRRGEIRLSTAPGWSLVSVTTVSTSRLMEVFNPRQYLCSVEGDLLDEEDDTHVFVGSLRLDEVAAGV